MREGIGDRFQRETKYHRGRMGEGFLDWDKRPQPFKRYPGAPEIVLPPPEPVGAVTLDETLKRRRSVRGFSQDPLKTGDLSYLLWASAGVRRRAGGFTFRTAPSAGALYPVETYVAANRVEGVESGIYHYAVEEHGLEQIRQGEFGAALASAALDQEMCASAAVILVWTAVFGRSKWKYGQRAYRYVYLDAGHIAQNLALAAVALGLGSCQVAALFDDEVNTIIGADGIGESVIYMSIVGRLLR